MLAHLQNVAGGLGLPFGERKVTYNSRLAQELGKWAESKGAGDAFHHAVFRAYFVEGENIAAVPVLVRVAESVNLNGEDALAILQDRTYKDAVDLDWQRSYKLKVTAVPTFACNHQTLVGAQSYKALEKLLLSNNVKKRNPVR
jgi:predicted DsbA family dithiol-disulfide isomerase